MFDDVVDPNRGIVSVVLTLYKRSVNVATVAVVGIWANPHGIYASFVDSVVPELSLNVIAPVVWL